MAHLRISKSCLLLATLLCLSASSSQAIDAVQIVAKAAVCFDNQTVIQGCLVAMGIDGSTAGTNNGSAAALCSPPCLQEMMLIADCVDGILKNFNFYKPGLMEGVKAIFAMSCGASTATGPAKTADGPAAAPAAAGTASVPGRAPAASASGSGRELGLPVWMFPSMFMPAALLLF